MKRRYMLTVILLAFAAIVCCLGHKEEVMTIAAGTKVKVIDQDIIDFYFTNASTDVVDSASIFKIRDDNGNVHTALCVDYPDEAPPNQTTMSLKNSNNRELLKVLYYGYGGPKQWSGFDDIPAYGATSKGTSKKVIKEAYARVATTICATCVRKGKTPDNPIAVPFWEFLFGADSNVAPPPDLNLEFQPALVEGKVDNIDGELCQVTNVVEVEGSASTSVTLDIYEPFTFYYRDKGKREFKKIDKKEIVVKTGSAFYIAAPITYTGDYNIDESYINENEYHVIIADPDDSEYQTIAGLKGELVSTGKFEASFKAPLGEFSLEKKSKIPAVTDNNKCYSLKNAEYGIFGTFEDAKNDSKIIRTVSTDGLGICTVGGLNYGTYYIKEIHAPKGFKKSDEIYSVKIDSSTHIPVLKVSEEPELSDINILLNKVDDNNKPVKGARFRVCYYAIDKDMSVDPAKKGYKAAKEWYFETDSAGKIKMLPEYKINGDKLYQDEEGNTVLPFGVITIQECEAPYQYKIDDTVYVRSIDNTSGENVSLYNAPTVSNEEIKGKICITKKGRKRIFDGVESLEKEAVLENITFKIYAAQDIATVNNTLIHKKGELVDTVVTDKNGYAESKPLVAGKYRISEIESEANKKYVIMEDKYISISHDESPKKSECMYETIDIVNNSVIPSISTSAYEYVSGTQIAPDEDKIKIVDKVSYDNLVVGLNYSIEGVLHNKYTRQPVLDDKGNQIKSVSNFTPESKNGVCNVEFEFDNITDNVDSIVVFEELILDGDVVAIHKDYSDEGQTIYFPEISTYFSGTNTGDKTVDADKEVKLTDSLEYKGLQGGSYKVLTKLYDKDSRKFLALDDEGGETLETFFTTETGDGIHDIDLTVDMTDHEGATVVCFEYLYKNNTLIYSHADENDERQSVQIREKMTTTSTETEETTEPVLLTEKQTDTEASEFIDTTETTETTDTVETTDTSESTERVSSEEGDNEIKTGDSYNIILVILLMLAMITLMFVVCINNKNKDF